MPVGSAPRSISANEDDDRGSWSTDSASSVIVQNINNYANGWNDFSNKHPTISFYLYFSSSGDAPKSDSDPSYSAGKWFTINTSSLGTGAVGADHTDPPASWGTSYGWSQSSNYAEVSFYDGGSRDNSFGQVVVSFYKSGSSLNCTILAAVNAWHKDTLSLTNAYVSGISISGGVDKNTATTLQNSLSTPYKFTHSGYKKSQYFNWAHGRYSDWFYLSTLNTSDS